MKKTKNLGLNLPEMGDVINIDDINENTEKMDTMHHPNLLLNPWFTVRQRGDGPFTNNYTADGWKIYNSTLTVSFNKQDGYIVATIKNPTGGLGYLQQPMTKTTKFPATLSVRLKNGDIISGTVNGYGDNVAIDKRSAVYLSDGEGFTLRMAAGAEIQIEGFKCEPGTISTMANDPVPDESDATELLKCQRWYYQSWDGDTENISEANALLTVAISLTTLPGPTYPVPMASIPSVVLYSPKTKAPNMITSWINDTDVGAGDTAKSNKRFIISAASIKGDGYYYHYAASCEP